MIAAMIPARSIRHRQKLAEISRGCNSRIANLSRD
jgi:hypothetical protein